MNESESLMEQVSELIDMEVFGIVTDLQNCRMPAGFPSLQGNDCGDLIDWSCTLKSEKFYTNQIYGLLRTLIQNCSEIDWVAMNPKWYQDRIACAVARISEEYAETMSVRQRWLDILNPHRNEIIEEY